MNDFLDTLVDEIKTKNIKFLLLYGDLGSGKTENTKKICKLLGVEEKIVSPTYLLHKMYKTKDESIKEVSHFDLYRIRDKRELEFIGWKNSAEMGCLVIVEWPDLVRKTIRDTYIELGLKLEGGVYTINRI